MSLTFADLKVELIRLCEHDSMEPTGTQAGRALNAAYRRLVQKARKTHVTEQIAAVPEAVTDADLGQVAVTMPTTADGLPKFWDITEVFYPDADSTGKLTLEEWRYEDGVLYLVDVDTDGTSRVTVRGYVLPEPMAAETDTPAALPPDLAEALVWWAYGEWAAGFAVEESQRARIAFYQQLAEQKLSLWQGRNPIKRRERGSHAPAERWVSIV